jgi:membrane fusion protein
MSPPPPPPSHPTPPAPLFRHDALNARRAPLHGEIVLLPSVWSAGVAWAAMLLVAGLVALLVLGSYTRRTTVSGQVYPDAGLIRITSAQPGVVVESHVREGQAVRQGDVLFVLSGDRAGPDALDYQRGIASQIDARRRSLEADLARLDGAEPQETAQWQRRIDSLDAESGRLAAQLTQLRMQVTSARQAVGRYAGLARQGYASQDELQLRQTELAQWLAQVAGLEREALGLERERGTARREIDALRVRHATQRGDLERAILSTRQEFTEAEARRRIVVSAPADGTVTLLRATVGQSLDPTRALCRLVPASAQRVARLYAPSRAAGFIRVGTPVLLRYDAFPFQKFGQQTGTVQTVSSAAATPAELDEAAVRTELATEPLFAVTVALPASGRTTTGHRLPLQVGMKVEADLLHERRPLYEWMVEPLLALRANL